MIASILSRRRRMIALCAATVLLHYLTVGWFGAHSGPLRDPPKQTAPATAITAQLRLTPMASPAPAPPAAQRPAPAPVPRPRPKRAPLVAPEPVAEPAPSVDPAPEPRQDTAITAPAASPSPEIAALVPLAQPTPNDAPDAAPEVTAAQADEAEKPSAEAAAPEPRRYKVSLPPSAQLALDVVRVNPDGTVWNGEGAMAWRLNSGSYKMSVEAGIRLLVARVNLLILTSEGTLDEAGIAPVTATEQRRGRAQTATHFNRSAGRITFSASERSYPLLPGAQDKATLPMQLAGIGRANSGLFRHGDAIEVLVGEDKEANTFRFLVLGQEQLETKLGTLQTWHLSRPPKPGAYSSRLDVWLAPGRDWYPVQIRNSEANGAVTTQIVTNITVNDSPGKQ